MYAISAALMADYKLCTEDTKDAATLAKIETYMDSFPDNASLEKHIASDLVWNSISIAAENADLVIKLATQNWLGVGTDAGLLMDHIIIGTNKFKLGAPIKMTSEDVSLVVKGFITSALHWEKMDGYVDCGVTKPWTQGPLIS